MKCTKQYRLSFTYKAREILNKMTLEEKVDIMSGNISFEKMVSDAVCEIQCTIITTLIRLEAMKLLTFRQCYFVMGHAT